MTLNFICLISNRGEEEDDVLEQFSIAPSAVQE